MAHIVRLADIPSTDRLLQAQPTADLIDRYGRPAVTDAIRQTLAGIRAAMTAQNAGDVLTDALIIARIADKLARDHAPTLRRVFNLTGTVLHTNLGRAPLPQEAIDAAAAVALGAANLEYDLADGGRGDRDDHVNALICRLTGAEDATIVNNNAAAVMLVLNSLGAGRDVPTSRGELVEIGGAFRMPDIMASSGCRLREVGTTNRTHLRDYAEAIGPDTGLVMKVHTSNYEVVGFTATVDEAALAKLCKERGVPFAIDLGSGSLVDLRRYGLPHEPTPAEAFAHGADLVTFSGDKLLGGPQAGIIAGRADLIAKIKRNPMKRALRVDKMTVATLAAVLRLYADPERLAQRLPTLRLLTRPLAEIDEAVARLCPMLAGALAAIATVEPVACESQIGSGALPTRRMPSAGVAIRPTARTGQGTALQRIEAAFRGLPAPVIGRMHDGALLLDMRCLEDEAGFIAQLDALRFE
jgi:L-seryl-tRNA(Ser) seleniumtransferase